MPTEIGKEWTQIFAYDLQTVGPREHAHKLGECSENCVMAREVKCVCRCGGKNHGAALKKDLKRLDEFNGPNEQPGARGHQEQAPVYIS
jgi:hypothetical protein